jgi:hypothetical protein
MRIQARITLPRTTRGTIDAARMLWNPEIASNNPAHVTVVYHGARLPDQGAAEARLRPDDEDERHPAAARGRTQRQP